MRTRRLAWRLMAPLWSLALSASAAAQTLNSQIELLHAHANLESSRIGVYIQDAQTGEVLAAINDQDPFIPASNMKLLTTGVALAVLGPEFTFRTELRLTDDALVVVGDGDPALGDPVLLAEMELGVEDLFQRWVDAIHNAGARDLQELIIDATIFDDQFVHPSWPKDQLNRWYAAEVAGVNFYTNVVSFYLSRESAGEPPRIALEPAAPWLRVRNRARTVGAGQNTVWVARPANSNQMTVYGDLRLSLHDPIRVAVHNPPEFFGRLLADRLEEAGLGRPTVRALGADDPAPGGETIALVTTPLPTAMRRCNVDSQNLYAEALLKRIGHEITGRPGAFPNGGAVARMVLQDLLGPADAAQTIIADGSGLSRENRVSPGTTGRWLRRIATDPELGGIYLESLPLAGADGTLARRFRSEELANEVRAKSGYIRGVSCLSGVIRDPETDRAVVFSILVNDIPQHRVPIARVKAFHESIVRLADGWLTDRLATMAAAGDDDDLGG